MLIIALGHKARHGKDTFASAVQKYCGPALNVRLVSFADPLRAEVAEWAKFLWKDQYGDSPFDGHEAMRLVCQYFNQPFEEHPLVDEVYPWGKQRVLYQWYGTEHRRAQDPEYWTKKAQAVIDRAVLDGVDVLIFRDLRFGNEYNLIGENGGWRIKVSRLGFDSGVPQHISETALDHHPFDLHLGIKDGELGLLEDLSVEMFRHVLTTHASRQIASA